MGVSNLVSIGVSDLVSVGVSDVGESVGVLVSVADGVPWVSAIAEDVVVEVLVVGGTVVGRVLVGVEV